MPTAVRMHSPLPWHVRKTRDESDRGGIASKHCRVAEAIHAADAAYIVTAANIHAELVECAEAIAVISAMGKFQSDEERVELLNMARAVLAKIRQPPPVGTQQMPTDDLDQICRDLFDEAVASGVPGMARLLRTWLAERDADANLRRVSEHFANVPAAPVGTARQYESVSVVIDKPTE